RRAGRRRGRVRRRPERDRAASASTPPLLWPAPLTRAWTCIQFLRLFIGRTPTVPRRGGRGHPAMPMRTEGYLYANLHRILTSGKRDSLIITTCVMERSEERRVGKECSARWAPLHRKQKKTHEMNKSARKVYENRRHYQLLSDA